MRCPACSSLADRVVDSRQSDDGTSIRRRRECGDCGRRYTTFERLEEVPLLVVKRSGGREPFDREKIVQGVTAASKSRPITDEQVQQLASDVEDVLRSPGVDPSTELVGQEVLIALRALDRVAAVRFASVHKAFEDIDDFAREILLLGEDEVSRIE